eukprot:NODE_16241_length_1005_cov_2.282460.p8 GENE.NODE_16241_length_1005_cov_2.282460~~NODE_16241_length_1005_cov_2.282460.p8  ORF type:complete len:61 (-),score=36.66 NODE_16241_length_1005_cov_2.282460:122-304(-)
MPHGTGLGPVHADAENGCYCRDDALNAARGRSLPEQLPPRALRMYEKKKKKKKKKKNLFL